MKTALIALALALAPSPAPASTGVVIERSPATGELLPIDTIEMPGYPIEEGQMLLVLPGEPPKDLLDGDGIPNYVMTSIAIQKKQPSQASRLFFLKKAFDSAKTRVEKDRIIEKMMRVIGGN